LEIINTTPHKIVIFNENLEIIKEYEAQTQSLELVENLIEEKTLNGIPLQVIHYENLSKLPEIQDNIYYIVSSIVQLNFPERKDFITPTALVRDHKGIIIGAKAFRS